MVDDVVDDLKQMGVRNRGSGTTGRERGDALVVARTIGAVEVSAAVILNQFNYLNSEMVISYEIIQVKQS